MAKYKVIGEQAVGGVAPGGTVELDLPDENISVLVEAGNLEPLKAARDDTTPSEPTPRRAARSRKGGK